MAASEHSEEAKALGERFTAYTLAHGLTVGDLHGALRALQFRLDAVQSLADARGAALAQYREALAKHRDALDCPDMIAGRDMMEQFRRDRDTLLAQPDPDQRGASILVAGEMLAKAALRAVRREGTLQRYEYLGDALEAWDIALRGATTSASAEPHKNSADF